MTRGKKIRTSARIESAFAGYGTAPVLTLKERDLLIEPPDHAVSGLRFVTVNHKASKSLRNWRV